MDIGSLHLADAQQAIPVSAQLLECGVHIRRMEIEDDGGFGELLIDGLRIGRIELFILGIFLVAQSKNDLPGFARLQNHPDMMRADRRPAVRHGVAGFAALHNRRPIPSARGAQERFALRVEPGGLGRTGEPREVIAPLAIFGLMIDDVVFYLHLSNAEVALKISGIVLRIPQAEFDGRKDRERGRRLPLVGHRELPDLEIFIERDEIAGAGQDATPLGTDGAVAHAVPAGILLHIAMGRLPGWRPVIACLVVAYVNVPSAQIEGDIVVAVARDTAQPRVAIERVTTGSIGNDAEVGLASQIINPWQRSIWPGNDIFPILVVKVSVLHINYPNRLIISKQTRPL